MRAMRQTHLAHEITALTAEALLLVPSVPSAITITKRVDSPDSGAHQHMPSE